MCGDFTDPSVSSYLEHECLAEFSLSIITRFYIERGARIDSMTLDCGNCFGTLCISKVLTNYSPLDEPLYFSIRSITFLKCLNI